MSYVIKYRRVGGDDDLPERDRRGRGDNGRGRPATAALPAPPAAPRGSASVQRQNSGQFST